MNVRKLKAKRVERNLRQKDLADALGITEKAMCHKECSPTNKFKAEEMIIVAEKLDLTISEFDAIFFDRRLSNMVSKHKKVDKNNTKQLIK
ncbi:helix-turn-helix domain-containing protein [Butyrivibrio sp. MB2005]|uniref:helix-turn-helix domain-containing protein n=1 Tax=Butyrivibrio sp. MB2005 TaxID=1280678 RepID=UPI00047B8A5F|nr:helix-turn-helix transcriptional regulator [Butyrivibrio sp. MB2005]